MKLWLASMFDFKFITFCSVTLIVCLIPHIFCAHKICHILSYCLVFLLVTDCPARGTAGAVRRW